MLIAERQLKIVETIQTQGSVLVDELAKDLEVSAMTIRRDLEKLQEDGIVERCHGGAVVKKEVTYADKRTSNNYAKLQIAARAATFVRENDSIYLDAGTTTFEIAKLIKKIPNLTVVTNDLEIAHLLKNSDIDLTICGGVVQKSTGSTYGYYATQMMEDFRFDIGFFGAASIDYDYNVLTPTIDKAFLKRQIVNHCQKSFLVVDQSKFGKEAMALINQLSDYTGIITDMPILEQEREKVVGKNIRIIMV